MASTIQSQTIGGVADKCIALSASQFGRAHGYGDNWNTLRIALNYNMEDTGANLSTYVLQVGLCSGTAHMPGDATTQNSYGFEVNQPLVRYLGPALFYYRSSPSGVAFTRVGTSKVLTSFNGIFSITTVNNLRTILFVDITKGSPNYTMKVFRLTDNVGTTDTSPTDFLNLLTSSPPARTNYVYSASFGSLAVDEGTNGVLDTVYVGWNLLTPRIFIGNLAVVRLA